MDGLESRREIASAKSKGTLPVARTVVTHSHLALLLAEFETVTQADIELAISAAHGQASRTDPNTNMRGQPTIGGVVSSTQWMLRFHKFGPGTQQVEGDVEPRLSSGRVALLKHTCDGLRADYADLGHRPIHDAMRQAFDRIDRADSTLKLDWTRYGRGLQADIERTFVDLVSTALDKARAANSIEAAKPPLQPAPPHWRQRRPSATTDVDESVPF